MQNLQRFLSRLGKQCSRCYTACLTQYSRTMLACGMAVVLCLSILPMVDGIFSISAQAAAAEEEADERNMYTAEREEIMEVTQADSKVIMLPELILAAKVSNTMEARKEAAAKENSLEIFGEGRDELLETDVLAEDEAATEDTAEQLPEYEMSMLEEAVETEEQPVVEIKSIEELFYESIDHAEIPKGLSVSYKPEFKMDLSAEQQKVLETIVEAEAGGEDIYGRMLVANVVLNRVLCDGFPDTVKEVVFQNNGKVYQFSPVRSGGRYYTVKVSECTKQAVERVLNGEDYSKGALFFFARRLTSEKQAKWFDTDLNKLLEYGCHEFFGNK